MKVRPVRRATIYYAAMPPETERKDPDAAVERERAFWDSDAQGAKFARTRVLLNRGIGSFYRGNEMYSLFDPRGLRVLDFGAGDGRQTIDLLERGAAHVTGFDLSAAQIERARAEVERRGLSDRADLFVGDAHDTGLPDGEFDLVVGVAILHHLDLARALAEIRRVLKPGGTAVFMEPMFHNPILRLGRLLTPSARTQDEHPLTAADWRLCASMFPNFRHSERELFSTLLMPLNVALPQRLQRRLAHGVAAIDDAVLARVPWFGCYARITFLVLE